MAARALIAAVALTTGISAGEVRGATGPGTSLLTAALRGSPGATSESYFSALDSRPRGVAAAMCASARACSPNPLWAALRVRELPDDSELKKRFGVLGDCLGRKDPSACSDSPECSWKGSCTSAVDLATIVDTWYGDEQTCGWLSAVQQSTHCSSKTGAECRASSSCAFNASTYRFQTGSACTLGEDCRAKSPDSLAIQALCDASLLHERCFSSEVQNTPAAMNALAECMREACPAIGDVVAAQVTSTCETRSSEDCTQAESCVLDSHGSCTFNDLPLYLEKVPDDCPAKEAALANSTCLAISSPEDCVGSCQWFQEKSCDGRSILSKSQCRLKESEHLRLLAAHLVGTQAIEAQLLADFTFAEEACPSAPTPEACLSLTPFQDLVQNLVAGAPDVIENATGTGQVAAVLANNTAILP